VHLRSEEAMASITIRNLDDDLKVRLRVRAAHHGHSMEEEAQHILRATLTDERQPAMNSSDSIRRRFAPLGVVDLSEPEREPFRDPPRFE
jgi:plasmid stability protein